MRTIKPIVNISRILDKYDAFIIDMLGVMHKGQGAMSQAVDALKKLKENNKKIYILTNSSRRVLDGYKYFTEQNIPTEYHDGYLTSGEVLYHKLKNKSKGFDKLGNKYYYLGANQEKSVLDEFDEYLKVSDVSDADFIFVTGIANPNDMIENYIPVLTLAKQKELPLLCANNDVTLYFNGIRGMGPGLIAEKYQEMGGTVKSVGKPQRELFDYCIEACEDIDKDRILVIGDSISNDIKGANAANVDSVLVTQGIHVDFLGEGYIPDIEKVRDLSLKYDAFPDWIISGFRW